MGRLQLHDVGEVLGAGQARGQIEDGIQISPGDVDDFAVECRSTLAGSVERLLKRRHGRVEGIRRAVIDLTRLRHSLLGKGAHALWNGSAETEETELGRHVAVIFAHWVTPQAIFLWAGSRRTTHP